MPGDEACDRSVTHACTSVERATAIFLTLLERAVGFHCICQARRQPQVGRSGPPLHTESAECRLWLATVRVG